MPRKKKAAAGVGSTRSSKEHNSTDSIPDENETVNSEAVPDSGAASWRTEAAELEMSENAKKSAELKNALIERLPVVHQGITYPEITGIIYRRHPHGGIRMQVELLDSCGRSHTIAAPKQVHVLDKQ